MQATEVRGDLRLALLDDVSGQEHEPAPAIRELQGHPTRSPGPVQEQDVAPLFPEALPDQGGQALQVDCHRVEGEAVGEVLQAPCGDRESALSELIMDLLKLLMIEEATPTHFDYQVEGVGALGRSERREGPDPGGMARADLDHFGDGNPPVQGGHEVCAGLPDPEGGSARRDATVTGMFPTEGSGIIRNEECSA